MRLQRGLLHHRVGRPSLRLLSPEPVRPRVGSKGRAVRGPDRLVWRPHPRTQHGGDAGHRGRARRPVLLHHPPRRLQSGVRRGEAHGFRQQVRTVGSVLGREEWSKGSGRTGRFRRRFGTSGTPEKPACTRCVSRLLRRHEGVKYRDRQSRTALCGALARTSIADSQRFLPTCSIHSTASGSVGLEVCHRSSRC